MSYNLRLRYLALPLKSRVLRTHPHHHILQLTINTLPRNVNVIPIHHRPDLLITTPQLRPKHEQAKENREQEDFAPRWE